MKCDRYVAYDVKGNPAKIFSPYSQRPDTAKACTGALELLSSTLVKCSKCNYTKVGSEEELKVLLKKSGESKPRLRKDDTPEGKKIWDDVDKAAEKAPKWVKSKLADVTQQEEE